MKTVSEFFKIYSTILNRSYRCSATVPQVCKATRLRAGMPKEGPTYICLFNSVHTNPGTDPPSYKQVKGNAIPLQAWIGPEDARSFRLPDFKTVDT
jgi:hypothetical protein